MIAFLIGQRSNIVRRIKLQFLGLLWTVTGVDTNTLAEDDPTGFVFDDAPPFRGIFVASEAATMVHYNAVCPRWASDQHREAMAAQAESERCHPTRVFFGRQLGTEGERILVEAINPAWVSVACNPNTYYLEEFR